MASRDERRERKQKQKRDTQVGEPLPWHARWTRGENAELAPPQEGREKMSAVLLDFLAPQLQFAEGEDDYRRVLMMGIVAWNIALVPEDARADLLQKMLTSLPPETSEAARAVIDDLVRRKDALFADNKRMILDYHLTMKPSGPYVEVVSAIDPGEQ